MMKLLKITSVLALAACEATTPMAGVQGADEFVRISTMEELQPYVGKRFVADNAYYVLNADGTITGEVAGIYTAGTWTMQDGYWCRVLTKGPKNTLEKRPSDCQLLEVSGDDRMRVTIDRGQGGAQVFRIS